MNRQQTIEPCGFCGDPSVEELELAPEITRSVEGTRQLVKRAVKVWACDFHASRVRGGAGWQERQDRSRRSTVEAKERLKRDQLGLL